MSSHRSSLSLGYEPVEPRVLAALHPAPTVGAFGGVEISPEFIVTSCDPEQLLAISTAFADAALRLQRLQDQAVAS